MGVSASKDVVLKQISEAESVFLSVNVSWGHSHFVLASTDCGSIEQSQPTSSSSSSIILIVAVLMVQLLQQGEVSLMVVLSVPCLNHPSTCSLCVTL